MQSLVADAAHELVLHSVTFMGQLDLLGPMFACYLHVFANKQRFLIVFFSKGFCSALRLEWWLVAPYDDLLPPAQLHQFMVRRYSWGKPGY